jgi:2-keto-3-deoxy-6-phosphogluconate aldolase
MPRGPKGEKRPADAIGNAVHVMRIATGEIEETTTADGKNAAAVALGRMGGKARAEGMSAKRRKEIAKKAAKTRWKDAAARERTKS